MGLSRRNLFGFGPALLAAAASPLRGMSASGTDENLAPSSRQDFAPLVNSAFELKAGDTRAWLTLTSVEDLNGKSAATDDARFSVPRPRSRVAAPQTDSFALHFYAPGVDLPQGTYTVTHGTLGSFPLFLVSSGNSTTYTAVFTRVL